MNMAIFDPKTTEMIALAAAVASNCLPCTEYHLAHAEKEGLTKEEIAELVNIATLVKQRPANEVSEMLAEYLGVRQDGCCSRDCRCMGNE
jgi:4-carboxymuconolactone decarboxylase